MRLRNLFEDKITEAAIMFGRFNPPHFGHVDAWKVAANFPVWYIGTNESTQGPKDPLPYEIKIEAMKTLYPEIEEHLVAEQNWFTLAVKVFKELGENAVLKIVTDPEDKDIYVPMIQKQNGVEGPHGYYKFQSIDWERAERKSEASLVRKAVRENNPVDFKKYSGTDPNMPIAGRPYFELVREYMLPYLEAEEEKKRQQQEREAKKAKAAEEKLKKQQKKSSKETDDMKMSELEEGGYGYNPDRDAERDWNAARRADQDFRNQERNAGLEDEEEYYQQQLARQREKDRGPWYLKINGKILKVKGEIKVFDWKKGANNYGLAILKKRPELQGKIMLTKKLEDEDNG